MRYGFLTHSSHYIDTLQEQFRNIGLETKQVTGSHTGPEEDIYKSSTDRSELPDYERPLWEPKPDLPEYGNTSSSPTQHRIERSWDSSEPQGVANHMQRQQARLFSVFFKSSDIGNGFRTMAQTDRYVDLEKFQRYKLSDYTLYSMSLSREWDVPTLMDLNLNSITSGQLATLIAPVHPAEISAPARPYVEHFSSISPTWGDA